jgi:subtilisin family serine protease
VSETLPLDFLKIIAKIVVERNIAERVMATGEVAGAVAESAERRKWRVADRLGRMDVLTGVLPTRLAPSPELNQVAASIFDNNIEFATRTATSFLRSTENDLSAGSAIPIFADSPPLRNQLAGFAKAGITFFHAQPDVWAMPPLKRGSLGGNSAVSRVLVANQRILLETARIVVRFESGAMAKRADILARHKLAEIPANDLPPDTVRAATMEGTAVDVSLAVMQEAGVLYAEPDFIEHVGQRHTPTDPDFPRQWHHKNLNCSEAWDSSKGEGVSIAVIDNGFNVKHGDLTFGPLSGWYRSTPDHVDADFIPGLTGMGGGDHGTACAGMVAAIENNDFGGCGVAFGATLNVIACLDDQVGAQSTLARAIAYAAGYRATPDPNARSVDIISCSLGPNTAQWTIQEVLSDAITYAATQGRAGKGCAIFWACTNGNFPISSDQVASHPDVMAVGRATRDDKDDGSGFGEQLEFLAPGVDVWIPTGNDAYAATTGTSFAAPCAAGVAALALAKRPGMTARTLRQLMRDTCEKIGNLPYIGGRNVRFGYGRVDARAAVAQAPTVVV